MIKLNSASRQSYDETPYESGAIPTAHPDRLCTIGGMFGMTPANVENCRVLELGCAEGGNLIPMALALPDSEFVGLDVSARQIAAGQQVAKALDLDNTQLEAADLGSVDESYGEFDYILCHGVYSWVEENVRNAILTICKRNLAPNGIALVSYNTYPGWHSRKLAHDLMRYHTRNIKDANKRAEQARAILDWMAESLPEGFSHRRALRDERELLDGCHDAYLLHEHLETVNQPMHFHEFAHGLSRFELQYLGDATPSTMSSVNLTDELARGVEHLGTDIISTEQYQDFILNRGFRSSLLCHREVSLNRDLGAGAIYDLALRSAATPSGPIDFEPGVVAEFKTSAAVAVETASPLTKAALVILGESYPDAVRFDGLHRMSLERLRTQLGRESDPSHEDGRAKLAIDLLHSVFSDLVEPRSWCPDVAVELGERPRASRLSALAVALGGRSSTSQFHHPIALEPAMCALIPLLDGTHDLPDLQAHLERRMSDAEDPLDVSDSPDPSPPGVLEDALAKLAGSALLVP